MSGIEQLLIMALPGLHRALPLAGSERDLRAVEV